MTSRATSRARVLPAARATTAASGQGDDGGQRGEEGVVVPRHVLGRQPGHRRGDRPPQHEAEPGVNPAQAAG
jgi:hypothetical protein